VSWRVCTARSRISAPDVVAADQRPRPAHLAAEAGDHLGHPVRRVRVPRAVLGVAVQRQVGQHEAEAIGQLLDQRLELAVGQQRRVQERERRPGARLAVGDARAVVVVVEAELHRVIAVLRSPYDREIVRLAAPALGALAAEPLYVLVDTAIVGHLGTTQLAALAIAATVLSSAFTIFNFLTYGTTARVARLHGAGRDEDAAALGAQALWLAVAIGLVLALFAGGARRAGGAHHGRRRADPRPGRAVPADRGARLAVLHARRGGPGLPARGRRPAHPAADPDRGAQRQRRARAAVRLRLRLGDRGLRVGHGDRPGSAWAPRSCGCRRGRRAGSRRTWSGSARCCRSAGEIAVRTTALLGSFLVASAVLARVGASSLAAHQIAFQLFVFLALVLDAIAIAGQVMVGRMLGAGDPGGARAAAVRMIGWSVLVGAFFAIALLALEGVIPRAFTSDGAVIDRAHAVWPLFAAIMPPGAAVFALDGILIGASDTRYLMWSMLAAAAVYIPLALLALHQGWGIVACGAGLAALFAVRLLTLGVRFAGQRWALTGAPA
jgi:Na+-driven multidrug efflux pump